LSHARRRGYCLEGIVKFNITYCRASLWKAVTDLPSGLLDGEGRRITRDETCAPWDSFDAEAQSPPLALRLGQIETSGFFDPAFFAASRHTSARCDAEKRHRQVAGSGRQCNLTA
jgi:hypothetical protein